MPFKIILPWGIVSVMMDIIRSKKSGILLVRVNYVIIIVLFATMLKTQIVMNV